MQQRVGLLYRASSGGKSGSRDGTRSCALLKMSRQDQEVMDPGGEGQLVRSQRQCSSLGLVHFTK